MISAVIPAMTAILRADPEFKALWSNVKDYLGERPPYLFPEQAPDGWPKPYVVYSVFDDESTKFGETIHPMKMFYVEFISHDYSTNGLLCLKRCQRIGALLSMRGLRTDPAVATAVRLYEDNGPVAVDTGSKKDVAFRVVFPLRGYDVGSANGRVSRDPGATFS